MDARVSTSAYAKTVPLGTKLIYAIGAASEGIINFAFNSFNFFFYTNVMGVPGTLAGLAITIALVFDAVTDPLVGSLSDRWRSRLGRRHPFMFMAPLPVATCLFLIYSPPNWGSTGLFIWLTTLTVVLRSTMTLFHVPHLALGAELSADFTERTRVMSMNTLFSFVGGFGTLFLGYSYFFAATPDFANGLLNAGRYPVFATTAAVAGGSLMLFSALRTRSVIPRLPVAPASLPKFSWIEFMRDFRLALRNRNYFVLLLGFLLLSATLGTRETVGLHMNTYYWGLLPEEIRYFSLVAMLGPVLGFLSAATLHQKFEKKPTLVALLSVYPLCASGPVILRMSGVFPANDDPILLPCLLGFYLCQMTVSLLLLITAASALADIADEQELMTGRRQEGIFYSARSFFGKAASGLGHLLAGIGIDVIEFPVHADPGEIPKQTLFELGLIDGPIGVIPAVLAIGFYVQFRLSRARHSEIQRLLEERARGEGDSLAPHS